MPYLVLLGEWWEIHVTGVHGDCVARDKPRKVSRSKSIKEYARWGASLVAQWLRICLLMQGTRVRALVWEDPTCHGAAGPVSHNC